MPDGVEELIVADPAERTIRWWARGQAGFAPVHASALLGVDAADVAARIDWP